MCQVKKERELGGGVYLDSLMADCLSGTYRISSAELATP